MEWSSDFGVESGDTAAAERTMLATLRAGLSTASYCTLFRAGLQSPTAFAPVLDTARALYSPTIKLWAGFKSPSLEDDAERFRRTANELADMAAKEGVTLCFGMGRGSAIDSYERARALMGAADHPFVKLCWEPLPGIPFDDAMATFNALSGRIGLLCARSAGEDGRNALLRERDEDWLLYLDAFDEQGGSPDMARYVVIRAFKDGKPESLEDDCRLIRTWSEKLRRYRRRRLI